MEERAWGTTGSRHCDSCQGGFYRERPSVRQGKIGNALINRHNGAM